MTGVIYTYDTINPLFWKVSCIMTEITNADWENMHSVTFSGTSFVNNLLLRWLYQEQRPVRPVMFLQWVQQWRLLSMPSVQKTSVMETLPYVSVATRSYWFQWSSFAKECDGSQAETETGAMRQRLSSYTLKAFICCYIAMKHCESAFSCRCIQPPLPLNA